MSEMTTLTFISHNKQKASTEVPFYRYGNWARTD